MTILISFTNCTLARLCNSRATDLVIGKELNFTAVWDNLYKILLKKQEKGIKKKHKIT